MRRHKIRFMRFFLFFIAMIIFSVFEDITVLHFTGHLLYTNIFDTLHIMIIIALVFTIVAELIEEEFDDGGKPLLDEIKLLTKKKK